MDPVLGSVVVALIASAGALGTAIITARSSAERLNDKERIRRLSKALSEHGGDPDEV